MEVLHQRCALIAVLAPPAVWPHVNSFILAGLRRYGHGHEAAQLFAGLFDAAVGVTNHRLPELFCGHERGDAEAPGPLTGRLVASVMGSWRAAVRPVWNLLKLHADAPNRRLNIIRPMLPRRL